MATAKSGKKPGSKSKTSKNKKNQMQDSIAIKNEIVLICILAIAVFLFLCNFGLVGSAGDFISSVLFGVFGILAYIVPIAIFVFVAFGLSNLGNYVATIKIAAGSVLFLLIGMIAELIWGVAVSLEGATTFGSLVHDIYYNSSEIGVGKLSAGGGIICGLPAYYLYSWLSGVGTGLVIFVLTIICFVILTGKSFINSVHKGSKIAVESAMENAVVLKEKADKRKEENAIKREELAAQREEEKRLRMDRKISGVMMDTKIDKEDKKNLGNDDIHEIVLKEEDTEDFDFSKIRVRGINIDSKPDNGIDRNPIVRSGIKTEVSHSEKSIETIGHQTLPRENTASSNQKEISEKKGSNEITNTLNEMPISGKNVTHQYKFPNINLLKKTDNKGMQDSTKSLKETALRLQQTLSTFGVKVTITDISQGPSVTRYELQPEQGVKVSKIVSLADDIKLNLAATDIRIEAPIPGKAAVGIEVPNKENISVGLRELLESKEFKEYPSNIVFTVGKDIGGQTVVADIAKMPHMLIAGATGSGKSVCINVLIMSILYKAHPDDVKLIMIDPKVVELSVYNGIPHLLIPVVTDCKKAAAALHWAVAEMTERYKTFADCNVRDLKGYNKKAESSINENGDTLKKMPQIVIIVDELADLMMVAPSEVEEAICRLAQLARAAGIHLIIATQRPSVDVITGLIKANMPSRVAFSVSSGVDSRTILDMNGAEKLLGKGDMLFYPQGYAKPARIQGAFVSDKEVSDVVDFLKNQAIGNIYSDEIEDKIASIGVGTNTGGVGTVAVDERDSYFIEAGRFIIEKDKASIGMLQRVFKVGFNRAARIMDQLSEAGVVGEEEGTKPRKILMSMEEFEAFADEYI